MIRNLFQIFVIIGLLFSFYGMQRIRAKRVSLSRMFAIEDNENEVFFHHCHIDAF